MIYLGEWGHRPWSGSGVGGRRSGFVRSGGMQCVHFHNYLNNYFTFLYPHSPAPSLYYPVNQDILCCVMHVKEPRTLIVKEKGLAPVFLDSRLEHPAGWICARYKSYNYYYYL